MGHDATVRSRQSTAIGGCVICVTLAAMGKSMLAVPPRGGATANIHEGE